ncbi:MAG: response regulator transcription factor [Geminicoccaceae bacterium]
MIDLLRTDLSIRERQCLELVARGYTSKRIGRSLRVSPRTVDVFILRARRKLGARTRSEAASLALRGGHIQIA